MADHEIGTHKDWLAAHEDKFEVCCIPFFAYDLAPGDVVRAEGERLRDPVRRAAVGQWRGPDHGQATRGRRRGAPAAARPAWPPGVLVRVVRAGLRRR
ncbi:MAG TPA: DUF4265 domain-containing protein [Jiangellaceae bacterium]|nr:DUF4265 domain-containing protein [Jiangellaceae bacterium]